MFDSGLNVEIVNRFIADMESEVTAEVVRPVSYQTITSLLSNPDDPVVREFLMMLSSIDFCGGLAYGGRIRSSPPKLNNNLFTIFSKISPITSSGEDDYV